MRNNVAVLLVFTLMLVSACTPAPTAAVAGIIQGVIYADTNGSGTIENDENPLDGVRVTITGCGSDQEQVTAANGVFKFANVPAGTCSLSASKTGWVYSGYFPGGDYPIPVIPDPALPAAFSIFLSPFTAATPGPTLPSTTSTVTVAAVAITPTSTASPLPVNSPTYTPPMVRAKGADVNCRYGPGLEWEAVGGLKASMLVPVYGTNADRTFYQIDSNWNAGMKCWVSAVATEIIGDAAGLPVLPAPYALVTGLSIYTPAEVHGTCGGSNPIALSLTVTTNGPANVIYHLEFYSADGTLLDSTGDSTERFSSAATRSFDPGGGFSADCGEYSVKAVVTGPSRISARANWTVMEP